ncbi:MAG: hypothetical protein WC851_01740 [Candidatus Shapirobacteria bacterium]|jgi:adenylate kinase family enzyme
METTHISDVELGELVKTTLPRLIFITGKTCTGKSTFAKSIIPLGYEHLELDFVVRESVVNKFEESKGGKAFSVYKGEAPKEWQDSFEAAAKKLIVEKLTQSKVIVDAALATPEVVGRIFSGELADFMFVYLHPFDATFYNEYIMARLINDIETMGRSFPIWDFMTAEAVDDYRRNGKAGEKIMRIVKEYGEQSIKTSVERYESFKSVYPNILLVGR